MASHRHPASGSFSLLAKRKMRNRGFYSASGLNPLLKVVGNEKLGGLQFLQLLGIGLGPWRLMSIFILKVPFAIEKRISVSALSSKMNRRFVCN
jgi:hypothetical protein